MPKTKARKTDARTMAKRPYYILAVRDYPALGTTNRKWGVEFGDYDKDCVEFEREDFRKNYPANCLKVIRLENSLQTTVNAAISELNGEIK